ncbi:uncharacterized protein [Palaemon carinicauda]|uniref:uncharacterized protein n=1 Tax=Palaemon carinicauda TaxID=392227 RepID=UPI0035B62993
MDEDIEVDLLISLVEANPVIWDKSLDHYKCREQTALAWKNVCCGLNEEFEHLDGKIKNEFGNRVVKKWRNVKDSWQKAQKKLLEQKSSGSGSKTLKKYVYDEKLHFLKKNGLSRKSKEGYTLEETKNIELDIAEIRSDKSVKESCSKCASKGNEKRKFDDIEEHAIKPIQTEENRHLSFFKGIVPSLEKFEEEEVIEFQVGVLNLIQKIRKRSRPHV